MDHKKYAQLLCSRLCHDLISPIGAINSGLEVLSDCDEESKEELMLLTIQSAETAAQRLMFYRAAFGHSVTAHFASFEQIEEVLQNFLRPIKIKLEWSQKPEKQLLQRCDINVAQFGRILTNLALVTVETAPYGGNLTLYSTLDGNVLTFDMVLTGRLVQMRKDNLRALNGELSEGELSPHTVQAYMTRELMDAQECLLTTKSATPEQLHFCLSKSVIHEQKTGSLF